MDGGYTGVGGSVSVLDDILIFVLGYIFFGS